MTKYIKWIGAPLVGAFATAALVATAVAGSYVWVETTGVTDLTGQLGPFGSCANSIFGVSAAVLYRLDCTDELESCTASGKVSGATDEAFADDAFGGDLVNGFGCEVTGSADSNTYCKIYSSSPVSAAGQSCLRSAIGGIGAWSEVETDAVIELHLVRAEVIRRGVAVNVREGSVLHARTGSESEYAAARRACGDHSVATPCLWRENGGTVEESP